MATATGTDQLKNLSDTALNHVDRWLKAKESLAQIELRRTVEQAQHPDAMVAEGFRTGGKSVQLHELRQDVRREKRRREEQE